MVSTKFLRSFRAFTRAECRDAVSCKPLPIFLHAFYTVDPMAKKSVTPSLGS